MGNVSKWKIKDRTALFMEDTRKGAKVGNYRPTACFLNLLLTGVISIRCNRFLDKNYMLPCEQKNVERTVSEQRIILVIDRCLLRNFK